MKPKCRWFLIQITTNFRDKTTFLHVLLSSACNQLLVSVSLAIKSEGNCLTKIVTPPLMRSLQLNAISCILQLLCKYYKKELCHIFVLYSNILYRSILWILPSTSQPPRATINIMIHIVSLQGFLDRIFYANKLIAGNASSGNCRTGSSSGLWHTWKEKLQSIS